MPGLLLTSSSHIKKACYLSPTIFFGKSSLMHGRTTADYIVLLFDVLLTEQFQFARYGLHKEKRDDS